jgi:phosphoribosylglycinamide formyltransferase-1
MINIAVFASGSGSNAENLVKYFENYKSTRVHMIFCNNPQAYVLQRAEKLNIPSFVFGKSEFYESDFVLQLLLKHKIDFIVLSGFLWLVPSAIIEKYKGRIINIHPALLPKYGGKGMYGNKDHQAVEKSGDSMSGITIHSVDENFDRGKILFQAIIPLDTNDSATEIAEKVHTLEYQFFPKIIGYYIDRYTDSKDKTD